VYKFVYASLLSDLGMLKEAMAYCNGIVSVVKDTQPKGKTKVGMCLFFA